MKLFERQFLPHVFEALQEQVKPIVHKLRTQGVSSATSAIDHIVLNQKIGGIVLDLYSVIGLYFANKTIHDLKQSEKKGFGFDEEFIRRIIQFFKNFLLNKVVIPITETTKDLIMQFLHRGISGGWGADKIANELESGELSLWRARMIVRTEANKAMNYGQLVGESKSPWLSTKRWIAANDHRTRHSHRIVDDNVIDFDDKFVVPIYLSKKGISIQAGVDFMTGPGDQNASAGNVINCRCSLAFAAKRDSRGRLIRKSEETMRKDFELLGLLKEN